MRPELTIRLTEPSLLYRMVLHQHMRIDCFGRTTVHSQCEILPSKHPALPMTACLPRECTQRPAVVQLSVLAVASSFVHTDLPELLGPLGEELVVVVVGHDSPQLPPPRERISPLSEDPIMVNVGTVRPTLTTSPFVRFSCLALA